MPRYVLGIRSQVGKTKFHVLVSVHSGFGLLEALLLFESLDAVRSVVPALAVRQDATMCRDVLRIAISMLLEQAPALNM